jgi:RNA polymerase sigma factor (sigma-70 family)
MSARAARVLGPSFQARLDFTDGRSGKNQDSWMTGLMTARMGNPPGSAIDAEEALRRCAAGDRTALRALYEREAPQMLGVAIRILRRRALAEEAVQDAFVQIWRKASTFDSNLGSGRTWVYSILRNRALNILRDEGRTDPTDDFEPFALESEEVDPEAAVARLSDAGALKRCLERLDPRRRASIVLAYMHGLTHAELAGRLGVPLGTVKSWIRRSLVALKECLE